jgi:cytochrome c556
MQKMYVLAIVTALVVVGALAQSESDYQAWMKSNPVNMGNLNKNIAAKDGAAAAADAQKLEATFKQVEDFWKKRGGADDAVNFAMKAQMAAAAVAKDALGGNFDQAAADVKSLQANCGGCHMAHREGAAGSFKIK